jgi:hypothetical protein
LPGQGHVLAASPASRADAAEHDRVDLLVERWPVVRLVGNEAGHHDEHGDTVGRRDEPVDAHAHARSDEHVVAPFSWSRRHRDVVNSRLSIKDAQKR